MLANSNSEITKTENNQLIIRGSRAGDVIYYVDGVKMNTMQSIPGAAIGGMTVFTGGVPAKYGDTTGGVVVLETKSYFDLYYAWKAK
jgi:outer membrane receptor protein involved in Fe transport